MDNTEITLEKHSGGTVWRRCVCDCGNVVYKKNLTTGEIQFLSKKGPKYVEQIPVNNVAQNGFPCEVCGMKHYVIHVAEGVSVSDEHFIHNDVAK